MKKGELKNKSTEKLQTQLKTIKLLTGILMGAMLVFFGLIIYGLTSIEDKTPFIALIAVGASLLVILGLQVINIYHIQAELELRKVTNCQNI